MRICDSAAIGEVEYEFERPRQNVTSNFSRTAAGERPGVRDVGGSRQGRRPNRAWREELLFLLETMRGALLAGTGEVPCGSWNGGNGAWAYVYRCSGAQSKAGGNGTCSGRYWACRSHLRKRA